jgi:5-methylcytosine-specific restriction protein A
MPRIPQEIQDEHVLAAIEASDRGVEHAFGESRDYDLLYEGKRYPPKAIIGIAAEYATGKRPHPSEFSSGVGAGQACRVLHDLGFVIVGKHSDDDVYAKPLFVPGETYRRRDLHEPYGGQGQGGISTPKDHPVIFLITGKSGNQYGYTDGFRDDGTFWYTGEGQAGDMEMARGNASILTHQANGKALYVFRDLGGGDLQFISEAE